MTTHLLIAEEEKLQNPAATAEPFVLPVRQSLLSPNMFSDCLVETSGQQRSLRRRTVLFSTIVQSVILTFLVLIPLIYTDVLPAGQLAAYLLAPPPPPPPPPAPAPAAKPVNVSSNLFNGQLITPTAIPTKIRMIHEEEAPPANEGVQGGVVGGIPGGQLGGVMGGVLGGIISSNHPPAVQPAQPKRVRISQGVSEGMLLNSARPDYPVVAKVAHVEGTVVLDAIISREGTIENLRLVSGNPILAGPAIDAVKQWRYKPYRLNGEPVEIETRITVIFQLNAS